LVRRPQRLSRLRRKSTPANLIAAGHNLESAADPTGSISENTNLMLSIRLAHDSGESSTEATSFKTNRFRGTVPKHAKPSSDVAFASAADHRSA
jgi:hypothetical protein